MPKIRDIEEGLVLSLVQYRHNKTFWEDLTKEEQSAARATVREFMILIQALRTIERNIKKEPRKRKPLVVVSGDARAG